MQFKKNPNKIHLNELFSMRYVACHSCLQKSQNLSERNPRNGLAQIRRPAATEIRNPARTQILRVSAEKLGAVQLQLGEVSPY